jgi:hypothetical protein
MTQPEPAKAPKPEPAPKPEVPKAEIPKPEASRLEAKVTASKPDAASAEKREAAAWPPPAGVRPLPKPRSAPITSLDLGLPTLQLESRAGFWGRLPLPGKLALAGALIAAITGVVYLISGDKAVARPAAVKSGTVVPGAPVADATWVEGWSEDAARQGRRITLFKSSLPLSDYRVQFEGQIETKALGWVYRAADPRNYYVAKLEIVKPGLEPTVAFSRFAVIQGKDEAKQSAVLRRTVRLDTLYKIRFEAVGSRFTVWIGDEKIEEWTDDRISAGAPGLVSDRGESSSLKGNMNVTPLTVSK